MATYVIGDVQGCFTALQCLLDKLAYSPSRDTLWFAGDLVNRGPQSLACLRWVSESGAQTVLGNHDLHLLAIYYGGRELLKRKDTLGEIIDAEDADHLLSWLRCQPLLMCDATRDVALSHAGVPHIWSMAKAQALAAELESLLRDGDYQAYFAAMYGNQPARWRDELQGLERMRVVTNYFTRMRFVQADGTLDFAAKEGLDAAPEGFAPWFEFARPDNTQIVFGHWAALEGATGHKQFQATDTGCVWGGALTALNIDTGERIYCDC